MTGDRGFDSPDATMALEELRRAYQGALAVGSPIQNAFAALAWILDESSDLPTPARAEAIARWLKSAELDRWRSPILESEAGANTLASYDYRKVAVEHLRRAAERFARSCGIAP